MFYLFKIYFITIILLLTKVENRRVRQDSISKVTFRNCPLGYGGEDCDIECGYVPVNDQAKIIGGKEAKPNSSPSTVFLLIKYVRMNDSKTFISEKCGGNLIDETTILTAGHCVEEKFDLNYYNPEKGSDFYSLDSAFAFLGMHNIASVSFDSPKVKPPAQRIKISKIIRHENYKSDTLENDIAILKLSKSVVLDNYIQIACLPSSNSILKPNLFAISFGWGLTEYAENAMLSSVLMRVGLILYDESKCAQVVESVPKNWTTQICAGDLNGIKSNCYGDSGGPLFLKKNIYGEERYVLVGLVSYGEGVCAKKDRPVIYTRVSSFIGWINSKV